MTLAQRRVLRNIAESSTGRLYYYKIIHRWSIPGSGFRTTTQTVQALTEAGLLVADSDKKYAPRALTETGKLVAGKRPEPAPVARGSHPVRTKQCKACPWRKDTVPDKDIPGGYCATKHAALSNTVAKPGELNLTGTLHMMACHESAVGKETPCVGWLVNQLGPGNNLGLRLMVMRDPRYHDLETVGEQHETLEDTLSKPKAAKVACVACGRVVAASKNGHPRRHSPKNRLAGSAHRDLGTCDGTMYPGDPP